MVELSEQVSSIKVLAQDARLCKRVSNQCQSGIPLCPGELPWSLHVLVRMPVYSKLVWLPAFLSRMNVRAPACAHMNMAEDQIKDIAGRLKGMAEMQDP